MIILGIDPGSRRTGFGLIEVLENKMHYISSGTIHIDSKLELPGRLKVIFDSLNQVVEQYQPDEAAIEKVFLAKNADSALKLGQARGAAIVAAVTHDLPVAEYEARKVKQSVVGTGAADKTQVAHMVKALLNLAGLPKEDAADALAVAICHCHSHSQQSMISLSTANSLGAKNFSRGRLK